MNCPYCSCVAELKIGPAEAEMMHEDIIYTNGTIGKRKPGQENIKAKFLCSTPNCECGGEFWIRKDPDY